jgi:hypothetical protein
MIVCANDPWVTTNFKPNCVGESSPLRFLSDGNLEFCSQLGLTRDFSQKGMGKRSRRFVLVLDNLLVKHLAVGEPPEGTSAEATLDAVRRLNENRFQVPEKEGREEQTRQEPLDEKPRGVWRMSDRQGEPSRAREQEYEYGQRQRGQEQQRGESDRSSDRDRERDRGQYYDQGAQQQQRQQPGAAERDRHLRQQEVPGWPGPERAQERDLDRGKVEGGYDRDRVRQKEEQHQPQYQSQQPTSGHKPGLVEKLTEKVKSLGIGSSKPEIEQRSFDAAYEEQQGQQQPSSRWRQRESDRGDIPISTGSRSSTTGGEQAPWWRR